jgi:hypothetical protein
MDVLRLALDRVDPALLIYGVIDANLLYSSFLSKCSLKSAVSAHVYVFSMSNSRIFLTADQVILLSCDFTLQHNLQTLLIYKVISGNFRLAGRHPLSGSKSGIRFGFFSSLCSMPIMEAFRVRGRSIENQLQKLSEGFIISSKF